MSKSAEVFSKQLPYVHRLTGELPPSKAARYLTEHLPRQDRPELTIVDSGCGEGRNSLFLVKEGFQIVALDASEKNLDVIRRKATEAQLAGDRLRCIVADAVEEIPVADASCVSVLDVFTLGAAILHFDGPSGAERYLTEVHRVLRPWGVLALEFETWRPPRPPGELLTYLGGLLADRFVVEHWKAVPADYVEKMEVTPLIDPLELAPRDVLFAVARRQ